MSGWRTEGGSAIDRSRPITFTFDGHAVSGFAGDTVASALLASGIHLMGRSFKYHRPRGVLGCGVEEPNALVGVDRGGARFEPNARATLVPIADGLAIESQNRSPGLSRDIGAINDLASAFIPAGFYYKTFMWPRRFWANVYEPVIRRAAGLGRPPTATDPDIYGMRFAHTETLIVGAGPAGLAAALAASAVPGRVMLVDDGEAPGGALRDEPGATIDGLAAAEWTRATLATLAARGVRLLPRTTAFAYGIGNCVTLAERCHEGAGRGVRERQWQVRAGRVILATGAIERPLTFPNNDRPGVMLASAARAYLHRFGALVGRRIVVATVHDSGWRAAIDLAAAGAHVTLADRRPTVADDLQAAAAAAGIVVRLASVPLDTRGRLRVSAVALGRANGGTRGWLPCDALLMAGGWTPSVHLYSQSGGKVRWNEEAAAFLPGEAVQPQQSAGACRGTYAIQDCLADGWAAGGGAGEAPACADRADSGMGPADPVRHPEGARLKAFVDFQNDVTAKDIRLAVREGFRSVEHLKRYTTNGMATDQGRTSNITALAIAAQAMGIGIAEAGLTTFRAPFTPVTFGTMAGHARADLFEPVRRTPMHDQAVAAGAVFEDVGQWKRARAFPQGGETLNEAVRRECRAVRQAVGMFDSSTLGKIEVAGPDAAAFLDRIYTGRMSALAIGRCRYGLILREDGFVMDDGIVSRLGEQHFHLTTTSGGAANVLALMEDFRQTEWPELSVWLTSTTEQWATVAVSGPDARRLIAPLIDDIDLAPAALPHMAIAHGRIGRIPLRLMRVSFTGELGYELNVPADHGPALWAMLAEAGRAHGLAPYGTDASHVLRAEKGYIIVGQETDGTVTPDDVGLGGMVAMRKADFLGQRSLLHPAMREDGRKQLVGISPVSGAAFDEGMQIVSPDAPNRSLGHVSSAYFGEAAGGWFGLAMVRDGRRRIGETLALATDRGPIPVQVTAPVFYDADGGRVHG